jgi:tripartite-type tricarboxylate transporter receptor subunit TctC
MAGQVQTMFVDLPPSLSMIKGGKIRVLAVATPQRLSILPDVPTMAEAGYKGFEPDAWMGLLAPAGVPADRVNALSAQVARIVHKPEVAQRMRELNLVPVGSTAAQFQAKLASDLAHWTRLIRELNISAE